jgi:MFS family permease
MVMESWLNASARNTGRARVFSIYRLVDLGAVAGAQFLLPIFGTGGFELFAVTAIFFSLSLVPVSLADRSSPKPPERFTFNLKDVWIISPLAALGVLTLELTNSAFRFIGPLYASKMGLDTGQIAVFIAANIVGGAILQYPLGYLSDHYDRRWLVVIATLGAAFAGIILSWTNPGQVNRVYFGSFLFGAFAIPLYSQSVAHANDRADASQYVLVAAGLLFIYAVGASIGPFLASIVIDVFGPPAFFVYTSLVHTLLIAATLIRMAKRPTVSHASRSRFAMLLRTSPMIARMANSRNGVGKKERK